MPTLKGKRIVISGGSRGIGEAIITRAAQDGAKIAILAKTDKPHDKLPGTIHTAADRVTKAGGIALPLCVNILDEAQVESAVAQIANEWGGIDIVINNASAIQLTPTLMTEMKRFDLMMGVNVRGTFLLTKKCLPHLIKGDNPHILNLSPPLSMQPKWFAPNLAYTMSKYGMSMCVLGWAKEFRKQGVAANALWPVTAIDTAAIRMLEKVSGTSLVKGSRTPDIVADAAHLILTRPSTECTGNFFTDEEVLKESGVTNFDKYAVSPGAPLVTDFFLDEEHLSGVK